MLSDISKPSREQLITAINSMPNNSILDNTVNLTNITPLVNDPSTKNTSLRVAAIENSGLFGYVDIKYNRNALTIFNTLNNNDPIEFIVGSDQPTLSAVVSLFNTKFNSALEVGIDIDASVQLPTITYDITSYNLTALSSALTYTGSVAIGLKLKPLILSDAPINVAASRITGGVNVTFTPPGYTGDLPITSYLATSSPGGHTASAASSPIAVTGLDAGVTYTFTVQAITGAGASVASDPSNSVTVLNNQTITFAQPTTQNFGTTPTLAATASSGLTPAFTSATPAICSITTGGDLTFNDVGNCIINANQAGNGSYLPAPQVQRTFAVAVVVPGKPTSLVASKGVGNNISVAFNAPSFTGGAPVTGYTVTSTPGNKTATGAASPLVVTGLDSNTAYTFTAVATNSAGSGLASNASNSVTTRTDQTVTFAQPATQTFGTTPTLAATSSSGLTPAFSSSTPAVCTITSGGALTFVTGGTCTINADQAGDATYNVAPQVTRSFGVTAIAPGAPTIGVASSGQQAASVSFTAPASNGGSPITSFTVTSSPGGLTASGGASPLVVSGLTAGTAYTFTVKATNSAGQSVASAASNSVTPTVQIIEGPLLTGVGTLGTTMATGATGRQAVAEYGGNAYIVGGNQGGSFDSLVHKFDPITQITVNINGDLGPGSGFVDTPRGKLSISASGVAYLLNVAACYSYNISTSAKASVAISGPGYSTTRMTTIAQNQGTFWIFGRMTTASTDYQFFRYNATTNTWTALDKTPFSSLVIATTALATSVYLNGYVYLLLGYGNRGAGGVAMKEHWRYDVAAGTWLRLADCPLSVNKDYWPVAVNNCIYLYGAAYATSGPSTKLLEYIPSTDTWTEKAVPAFGNAADAACIGLGGRLYAFGGSSSIGGTPTAEVRVLANQLAASYTNLATLPVVTGYVWAAESGGNIYMVAGRIANGANNSLYRYTPSNGLWTQMANAPGNIATAYGSNLYATGGKLYHFANATTVYIYDIATNTWSSATFASTLNSDAVVVWNGTLGYCFTSTSGIRVYDAIANTWAAFTSYPATLSGNHTCAVATIIGNYLYYFGRDMTGASGDMTTQNWRLDLTTKVWTQLATSPRKWTTIKPIVLGNYVYFYGDNPVSNSVSATTTLYEYNSTTDKWRQLTDGSVSVAFAGYAKLGNEMYVVGGYAASSNGRNTFFKIT